MSPKIARVETFHLRQPIARPFGPSAGYLSYWDTLLVKITTDDGLVGWGETAPLAAARPMIDRELGPSLIGEDPRDTRRLWHRLWGANFGNSFAVGGIDIALHDLRGKLLGQSIGQLFGGAEPPL